MKMNRTNIKIHCNVSLRNAAGIIVLLLYLTSLEAKPSTKRRCPIGFDATETYHGDIVCYRRKGPEAFADKFENCPGNLFTQKLYQSLNIERPEQSIWTDYKNLYDGGPFVDWSYTNYTGELLESTFQVHRDPAYSVNEELCVIMDPVINFTTVRCDEKHYRYCFLAAYPTDVNEMTKEGCDETFEDSTSDVWRFWSPRPTCLMALVGEGGGSVRATWNQAQNMCRKRGGSLLNRGWRYSNFRFFSDKVFPIYPLGIKSNANLTLLRYDAANDNAVIPPSEVHFVGPMTSETTLGAMRDNSWELVNGSYTFYNVICEKSIQLRHVNLTVYINSEDNISLNVNDTLPLENIECFTDSSGFYPQRVIVIPNTTNTYILKRIQDGHYWCTHTDTRNFYTSESKKVLHIKVKEETLNLYAVKLTFSRDYTFDNLQILLEKVWKKKLEEYVFFSTKYSKTGFQDSYDNYTIMQFRKTSPGLDVKKDIVQNPVLKRVYLNERTALLHLKLHPDMLPAKQGRWEDVFVEYMRPAYYCQAKDTSYRLALGETSGPSDCKIYKCIGDFNEGVQLLITAEDTCYTPKPRGLGSSVSVDDVISVGPTPPSILDVMPTAPIQLKPTEATTQHQLHRDVNSSDSSEEDFPPKNTTIPDITTEAVTEIATEAMKVTEITTDAMKVTEITTDAMIITEISELTETPETTEVASSYGSQKPTEPSKPTWPPRPPTVSTLPTPVITAEPVYPTTPQPPSEQLQQVIEDLAALLNNNTDPIPVADIDVTFDSVSGLLADTEDLEIPGNLLHLLDELGGRIDLAGSNDASAIRDNVALLVADAQPDAPVRGLKIAQRTSDEFTDNAFEIIRENINSTHLEVDRSEVVIQLPESVATTSRRISFVVFRNDRAFQSSHGLYSVNSRVLSINVENTTKFHDGEVIDIHLSPMIEDPGRNQSRACAYWHFLEDGSGYWSEEGCEFHRATTAGQLDTCRCDHLTHFAEILIPRTVFSERNENILEIISIIGCCVSIFGLILVGVTALMFRSWRRDYSNKIWLQLCISIFILSLAFLVILFAHFDQYDVLCMLTGIVLHFSVLSSFCWMLVAAVLSYRRLVTVFSRDPSHKLLRASAFAWGAPCAVVGILLSVAPHSYAGRFEDKTPTAAFCYPSGLALWLAVFAPIAIMLLANWTLFALIVRSVFASRRIQRHGDNTNEALRCASVSFFLVFLFGLPWVFGLFASNIVMSYFFVILSTFQGFVLFSFFVLGNKKTRDLWLNQLKIKQTRKLPVTSSTYTNRSTGGHVGSRGVNQSESIEAKVSKPKSLSSSDNSRFS